MKKILFVLFLSLISNFAKAQIIIYNSSLTPQQLVQQTLLGQGVNITNIKFNGSSANGISDQIGRFDNGNTANLGLNKGLILSTGNAIIATGPNDRSLATLPTSTPVEGDDDLSILTNNQPIKNVAVLEFDFIPVGNKLTFNFVFASDEYPEFANDTYNDNFGFFISGPGITGPYSGNAKNIALIPNTSLPVSINNLNNGKSNAGPCEYCQYYVDNTGGLTIQYDGFTKVIQASSDVQCGQTYHIKLAIANVDDNNFDSAVFIEGASFSSSGINLGEDLRVCKTTNYTLKTGLDPSVVHEWSYNGQIIPFEKGPEITVDQSGTYGVKATPIGIACPVSDEIQIVFDPVLTPYLYCGNKTTNSITFDWLALGYAEFSVAYQIGNNTPIDVGPVGKVYSYTINNVPHNETVTITVSPTGGTPAECFGPDSISCVLDTCLDSPTLIVDQGNASQQICENTAISDIIFTIDGGATSASLTSGNLPSGLTTNLVGNKFTILGIATIAGTFNYTISTSGGCGTQASVNGSIIVNQKTDPIFPQIAPICVGETITPLPLLSNNGISGTWSPNVNTIRTTEYTFTPEAGQCSNSIKRTLIVNEKTTPVFNIVSAFCEGEIIADLPLQSDNGITGTWIPSLNNTTTTEYTFTPNLDQCANSTKVTLNINQKATPVFNSINPICEGENLTPLPLQSINGIKGTWAPALNNATTTQYTFSPNLGECANSVQLTIVVNQKIVPLFSLVAPVCEGDPISSLPLQSLNGITGAWSPLLNNLKSTEYTFTPNSQECNSSAKLIITINPKPIPKIEGGKICIEKNTNKLLQSYNLNTKLSSYNYNFEWFLDAEKIENQYDSFLEATKIGTYSVIATDKNTACVSDFIEAEVTNTESDSGEISIKQSESFSENPTITVNITNSSGQFEYQLDNHKFQSSNEFKDINPGTHLITVQEINGCRKFTKEIIVIGYPKFFTPNGDTFNDTWNIIGFEDLENDTIFIFDRYGKLLKQMNSKVLGWDGTYNGQPMPSSDYWFKVFFTENNIKKEFKSHFSLKR